MRGPLPARALSARLPIWLPLALLLAGVMLAACGEDSAQEVEEVAIAYGESDGAKACEFLSSSALDQLGGESGCTRTFEEVGPAEFEIRQVEVTDDTATARVENVEEDQVIELGFEKEDGEWRISSFPGIETFAPPGEAPGDEPGGETSPEGEAPEETAPESGGTEPRE